MAVVGPVWGGEDVDGDGVSWGRMKMRSGRGY